MSGTTRREVRTPGTHRGANTAAERWSSLATAIGDALRSSRRLARRTQDPAGDVVGVGKVLHKAVRARRVEFVHRAAAGADREDAAAVGAGAGDVVDGVADDEDAVVIDRQAVAVVLVKPATGDRRQFRARRRVLAPGADGEPIGIKADRADLQPAVLGPVAGEQAERDVALAPESADQVDRPRERGDAVPARLDPCPQAF